MKKKYYLATSATLIACLSSCSSFDSLHPFDQTQAALVMRQYYTARPAQQMIKINFPRNEAWKKIDISPEKKGSPVILIPNNQTATDWNESIQTKIGPFVGDPDITAKKFVQNEIDAAAYHCKYLTSKILSETEQYVIYRLDAAGCNKGKDHNEIGKAFNGHDAVYLVKYSAVNIGQIEFSKMANIIKSAQLVKDPRHQMNR